MRLLEFQAKRLFLESGILIPKGKLITMKSEFIGISLPAVIKAQVPVGGRGKAGAIKVVHELSEAEHEIEKLLNLTIRGYPVRAVLVEEYLSIQREIFLSIYMNGNKSMPVIIVSPIGGVDIEETSNTNPEMIYTKEVDPLLGMSDYIVRYIGKVLGFENNHALRRIIEGMQGIMNRYDASLVEVNPLAETSQGLIALDAKVILDDKAGFRHIDLFSELKKEQTKLVAECSSESQKLASQYEITYVEMDGEIGIVSDGAGTGMLTLDLVSDFGGKPANFCEMGGRAGVERMRQALEVILSDSRVKVLLVSLIGGLTRMDQMAEGIKKFIEESNLNLPIVIRMCGTKEEIGKQILREIGIEVYTDLISAVQHAVEIAGVS